MSIKVLMLRNNDRPDYDSRMALQKEALDNANYDVHQIFLNYKRGVNIYHTHGQKIEKIILFGSLGRLSKDLKIAVPYKHYSGERILYQFITKLNINPDIIHAHNLNTMHLANRLKKKYGSKLIYDMREYWAEMVGRDFSPVVKNYYWKQEGYMCKQADWIFAVEKPMKDMYEDLIPDATPVTVVGLTKPLVYNEYSNPPLPDKPLVLVYLGTIGATRYTKEIIDVVETFKGDVKFYIGGYSQYNNYYNEILDICSKSKNCSFIGCIPHDEVIKYMHDKCHAIIHMIDPHDFNGSHGTSNKQFEAWCAGRPIICTRNTYAGLLNEEYGTGPIIPHAKKGVKFAIKQLLEKPRAREQYGRNGLKIAKEKYNWEVDKKRMLKAYELLSGWKNDK